MTVIAQNKKPFFSTLTTGYKNGAHICLDVYKLLNKSFKVYK